MRVLGSSKSFIDQNLYLNPTVFGASCLLFVRGLCTVLAHRAGSDDVPNWNSTLLLQPRYDLLSAIFAQLCVHCRIAGSVGETGYLDYVASESLRRLRQLCELCSVGFGNFAATNCEVNRSIAFDFEVCQGVKAPRVFLDRAEVLLNLSFIGSDILLISS